MRKASVLWGVAVSYSVHSGTMSSLDYVNVHAYRQVGSAFPQSRTPERLQMSKLSGGRHLNMRVTFLP